MPKIPLIATITQWIMGSADHPRSGGDRLKRIAIACTLALLPVVLIVSSVAADVPGQLAKKATTATTAPAANTASATPRPTQTAGTHATATAANKPAINGPPAPPIPPGQLVFDDEFNGSSLDTTKWIALNRPGDASNFEQECYVPSNATEGGGSLTLTSKLDSSCSGFTHTSGAVQTKTFNFLYGRVEIRAKMPHGQGMWPALWLLGANCQSTNPISPDNSGACQWPTPGSDEVDILEMRGQDPTTDVMTTNYGTVPDQDHYLQCTYTGPDFSQGFHTFALIWIPGKLTWLVDGVQRCVQTTGVPSHPLFLILNSAVGGSFVGGVDDTIFPQTHVIDYVRVYH